jgi:hypothetical protein
MLYIQQVWLPTRLPTMNVEEIIIEKEEIKDEIEDYESENFENEEDDTDEDEPKIETTFVKWWVSIVGNNVHMQLQLKFSSFLAYPAMIRKTTQVQTVTTQIPKTLMIPLPQYLASQIRMVRLRRSAKKRRKGKRPKRRKRNTGIGKKKMTIWLTQPSYTIVWYAKISLAARKN